ncbi:hypothetical protein AOL_s00110g209 [Orbilia oligospora ATCC 24927]|uniref:Uncharacterized protein n=1 Tax=Arthrobotrys oligospora (strain ATCC 24927 / CBS 115.81 / DSM 1491) TaxID=756982 RepID=G1XL39_ARTOA|nr:hypothetical protein AOL_s00110g209 [Orbilia oligospora ATCC 24927]EGX46045.1 hypothetical protein AOL_s00110g209 [Orbilia oligospora ATCC 24927]
MSGSKTALIPIDPPADTLRYQSLLPEELIRCLYIARLWEVKKLQEVVVKAIMLKSYELKQLDRKVETNEEV